jgi:TetR/AcrR family transcriptional regulator, transcriptional repressor for nem operon
VSRPSLRDKIVEAALDRFQAQGFSGCSVQDITDAAGVPKGSFYNHFKTKESLALAVLDRYQEGTRMGMLFEGTGSPLTRLRGHFDYLAQKMCECSFHHGCVIEKFGADMSEDYPDMRQALCQGMENWTAAITAVLRQAQAEGELSANKDSDVLARFIINAWQGATARQAVVRNRVPLDDFFRVTFDTLLS